MADDKIQSIPKLVGDPLPADTGQRTDNDKAILISTNPGDPENNRQIVGMKLADLITQAGYIVKSTVAPTSSNISDGNGAFPIGTLWINTSNGTYYFLRSVNAGVGTWDNVSMGLTLDKARNANPSTLTSDRFTTTAGLEDAAKIAITFGNQTYYIPAITNANNNFRVGCHNNCHGSCHGSCHGHCSGIKGVGI